MNGLDMSGYTRSIGECDWSFAEAEGTTLTDEVVGALPGQATIRTGDISANYDNTATTGLHPVAKSLGGTMVNVMMPLGIRAAPASGDEVWCAQNELSHYKVTELAGGNIVAVTMKFSPWSVRGDTLVYDIPWGNLMHAYGAETAVNSSTSDHDYGSQTTKGGYMVYHSGTADGTATIKVQDASTDSDGSYGDLLTSGVVDPSSAPVYGAVALALDATVERYTRWQIVLGTATTVTFTLAFVRRIQ